ncbi:MAG: DUF4838 domain-containing protein [Ruminococcaceae bacterium]|nr:DUF4838 domain-containing protein [Oscillospiraceae bacterium]
MKRFISMLLLAMMLLTAIPMSAFAAEDKLPFVDVKESAWYYAAAKWAYENGVMKGTNAQGTTFTPNRTMTRAEFATTLFRISGANEAEYQGETGFPDVPAGQWMSAAAKWAAEKGYVKGNDKGQFMPNVTLDRQTLATMIYRYACDQYSTMTARQTAFDRFGDASATADWAAEAMTWVVTVELINGTGETVKGAPTLAPKMSASRAQVAQILMNYANLQYNQPYNVGDILIGDTSISEYTIVYGPAEGNLVAEKDDDYRELYPSLNEDENAALELQKYIKMATGFELPVVSDSAETTDYEILVGKTSREGNVVTVDRSKCGNDGDAYIIQVQGTRLIIASNEKSHGTLYGAYDFLETYAGINYFGFDETVDLKKCFYVPSNLDHFETSATKDYRCFYAKDYGNEGKWKLFPPSDINGFYHALPSFGKDPSEFVPSWSYQVELHKTKDPCLTDPEIQQNIVTNARNFAGKDGIWCAMSDGTQYCKCTNCAKAYREKGRLGPYVDILDIVADAIPDTKIVGAAYNYTWGLLKGYEPGDVNENVVIVVCTNDLCATHMIDDPNCKNTVHPNVTLEVNSGGYLTTKDGMNEMFLEICRVIPNVWVWDYVFPADHNEAPLPLFHRMYHNYNYYFTHGVTGMFFQNTTDDNACFDVMRNYMGAKLMHDGKDMTEKEYWAYIEEFMKAYYGDGYTYILEYINFAYELQSENEWHLWTKEKWYDIITEEQYRENFDYMMGLWEKAESLAQTEEMAYRVRRDSTQMKFIELCLAYEDYMDSDRTAEDEAYYVDNYRTPYIERLASYGFMEPYYCHTKLNPADWRVAEY